MAFFDDISRKISQTGQNAVHKTKEMADLAKINTAIAEEEKKINGSYQQIGKLYAAVHREDYEEDFAQYMTAVRESEEKIRNCRQQIMDIRGMAYCEKCKAEIPNNVAFCSSCGAPVPKQEMPADESDFISCPGCGQMVPRGSKFCTSCGEPLESGLQKEESSFAENGKE